VAVGSGWMARHADDTTTGAERFQCRHRLGQPAGCRSWQRLRRGCVSAGEHPETGTPRLAPLAETACPARGTSITASKTRNSTRGARPRGLTPPTGSVVCTIIHLMRPCHDGRRARMRGRLSLAPMGPPRQQLVDDQVRRASPRARSCPIRRLTVWTTQSISTV